ncbi:hypothetical protein FJT64_001345 [Amphibalanus amphitrite]|uniref:Uncharacterized protein n=1 Tax=Amphibalanus amphitrite TaxID=1232801 RepID=A0A6A4V7A8_AMPAM|nr:hypothetical protein FJT64_001345 [Amphibalanus amphitrite]
MRQYHKESWIKHKKKVCNLEKWTLLTWVMLLHFKKIQLQLVREAVVKKNATMTAVINGMPVQISPLSLDSEGSASVDLSGLSVSSDESDTVTGELVAADEVGNMAAGMAELEMPAKGAKGPVYELVGAGVRLQPPKQRPRPPPPPPPPPPRPRPRPASQKSAVGEVMVNIQQDDQKRFGKKPQRHWCDLGGVWINDEGSLLLTLGFPAADRTVLSGYLSQVSVDMTPEDRRRRRRRRRQADTATEAPTRPPPRFRPPPAGASGLPSSLTNRTALQGSAVSRAGPFALATKHSGGAVGSLVGQCQTCGGLDTIVAHVFAVSEVFTCLDAMWNQKAVRVMFRKWGERHRRRHRPPLELDTEVVIKQRDRGPQRPPPPPPPREETMVLTEEVVDKYGQR